MLFWNIFSLSSIINFLTNGSWVICWYILLKWMYSETNSSILKKWFSTNKMDNPTIIAMSMLVAIVIIAIRFQTLYKYVPDIFLYRVFFSFQKSIKVHEKINKLRVLFILKRIRRIFTKSSWVFLSIFYFKVPNQYQLSVIHQPNQVLPLNNRTFFIENHLT